MSGHWTHSLCPGSLFYCAALLYNVIFGKCSSSKVSCNSMSMEVQMLNMDLQTLDMLSLDMDAQTLGLFFAENSDDIYSELKHSRASPPFLWLLDVSLTRFSSLSFASAAAGAEQTQCFTSETSHSVPHTC